MKIPASYIEGQPRTSRIGQKVNNNAAWEIAVAAKLLDLGTRVGGRPTEGPL